MSMIGLAQSPGTEVEPTCSINSAVSPIASLIFSASIENSAGHCGSYSASVIWPFSTGGSPIVTCRSSSLVDGSSARLRSAIVKHPPLSGSLKLRHPSRTGATL